MDQSTPAPISVLLVDDHPVVRAGLASMLGTCNRLSIVGSATNGRDALQFLERQPVDVMLLDLRMPTMSGIDTLLALKTHKSPPRTIVLTTYEMDEDVFQAVQAGALGYLLKDTCLSEMIEAIEVVQSGKRYLPRHIASQLAERMSRSTLTPREIEIISIVAKGLTNREIGSVLHISENTVRNHINSIMEKLEVSGRTEAATSALHRGIIHQS